MSVRLKFTAFMAVCGALLMTPGAGAEEHLKKHIHGKLRNDVYTSDHGGFRVRIPVHEELGGAMRDEYGIQGEMEISQVIFTDDFGRFYRIVSTKTSRPLDDIMNVFRDVREKKEIQTARGRELHVLNVEKHGAEISVTTIEKDLPPQTVTPDLVTVNAIFTAHGHIYHLCAGFPLMGKSTVEQVAEFLKQDLEKMLEGFEVLDGDSRGRSSAAELIPHVRRG